MEKMGFVYILASKKNGTLYTGVTSDLKLRIWKHKMGLYQKSFTAKYKVNLLVYYKVFPAIMYAIEEEKRIKGGSRKRKIDLIEKENPEWNDLWDDVSKW
jgi:putative endonuclease